MSVPGPCSRQPKPLAAGVFQPEIGSFRLCLMAEGKSGKTVRMYTEAAAMAGHGRPGGLWVFCGDHGTRALASWHGNALSLARSRR